MQFSQKQYTYGSQLRPDTAQRPKNWVLISSIIGGVSALLLIIVALSVALFITTNRHVDTVASAANEGAEIASGSAGDDTAETQPESDTMPKEDSEDQAQPRVDEPLVTSNSSQSGRPGPQVGESTPTIPPPIPQDSPVADPIEPEFNPDSDKETPFSEDADPFGITSSSPVSSSSPNHGTESDDDVQPEDAMNSDLAVSGSAVQIRFYEEIAISMPEVQFKDGDKFEVVVQPQGDLVRCSNDSFETDLKGTTRASHLAYYGKDLRIYTQLLKNSKGLFLRIYFTRGSDPEKVTMPELVNTIVSAKGVFESSQKRGEEARSDAKDAQSAAEYYRYKDGTRVVASGGGGELRGVNGREAYALDRLNQAKQEAQLARNAAGTARALINKNLPTASAMGELSGKLFYDIEIYKVNAKSRTLVAQFADQ